MTSNRLLQMYGVGLMAFVLFLSTLVGDPVLPDLSQLLGAGATEIPIVVSASLATVVIVQFFTGILADRYPKRVLILVGALLGSLSSLGCAIAPHWIVLAALRVLGGIADAIAMPALLAITASLGTDQPGKFFGILRGSQGLSFVMGPALGGLFSFVDLRTPFVVDGVLSLLAFFVALILLKDTERVKSAHNLSVLGSLKQVFSSARIYLYLLMGISGMFGFGILRSFVPTQAQLIGVPAWKIGAILSGGALVFSFISYVMGTLSDTFGRRPFVVVAQVIIVFSGIILAWGNSFTMLFLGYGLFCVGETITYLLCFVYATESFDPERVGTAMGVFDSVMDLSLFVGPLLAISIHKAIGQIAPTFLLAVIPAILAFFVTATWLPRDVRLNKT